ncbi:hypothetical protein GOBAR_AA15605 [Gossypium barbadense]|uniref:Uncharacterized protein n=1 Tax=Gossypium barbadense TaxID=3634 RepID=A0A2P5XNZ5_GOSBA|nr:hypothetical protein GOBAR_AA15605 [Gossypium barbadense]
MALDHEVDTKCLSLPSLPPLCTTYSLRLPQSVWVLKRMLVGLRPTIESSKPYVKGIMNSFGKLEVEKDKSRALKTELGRIGEKNKVTTDRTIVEHKDSIARSEQKHVEALDGFKKNSMETIAKWKEFTTKWRGSKDFYLEGGSIETSTTPDSDINNTVAEPFVENIEASEGEMRGNEACDDLGKFLT